MVKDTLTLRSSIHTPLLRYTLWRGTVLAVIGALLLLVGGAFIPPHQLSLWGFPIFIIGIGLITWGMLPYRQLKRLENTPNMLAVDPDWIILSVKNTPTLSIPVAVIEKVHYIEDGKNYGIGVNLKKPTSLKVISHVKGLAMREFRHRDCDVFLPFFSIRSCATLENYLSD